jgi:N-carbamoylputrescine amidase
MGNIIKNMDEKSEGIIFQEFDLDEIKKYRQSWGNFRDRRPDLYKKICDF